MKKRKKKEKFGTSHFSEDLMTTGVIKVKDSVLKRDATPSEVEG